MHWGLIHPGVCFELSVIRTCVSVRRRDRCTCTALIRFAFLVLFCCTPLLLSVLISHRALLRSCALCLSIALSVLSSFSLSVLYFFACVALWGSCDCAVFVLLWARRLSWFLRSSLCLCGPWCFPCCLPSFVVVPVSVLRCHPCPASGLICALVQLAPRCAGASLWVSGCSCDGSVALLSCWECGLALLSFRHSVHGNKGY